MSIRRQTFTGLALLLGAYFIITLSRDLLELLASRERIASEQAEVSKLEAQQQELAGELEYVMSDEFVEREAREKLLMTKSGETVVLLPEEPERDKPVSAESSDGAKDLANWEKWLRLFL